MTGYTNQQIGIEIGSRHPHSLMSVCKVCEEPLVLRLDPDEDEDEAGPSGTGVLETVPDDVELRCGCHFHWYVTPIHPFSWSVV